MRSGVQRRRGLAHARRRGVHGTTRRGRAAIGFAATVTLVAAALVVGVFTAPRAAALTYRFEVESAAFGGGDALLSDGICTTMVTLLPIGPCTLQAAIEQANYSNSSGEHEVFITVDDDIPIGSPMTGTPTRMDTSTDVSYIAGLGDIYGAVFVITAPMTINLEHRLLPDATQSSAEIAESAAFHINSPNVTLLNVDDALSSGTSFVFGPLADNVLVDGSEDGVRRGTVITEKNWFPERFALFKPGAKNITLRGYDVQGFYNSATEGGIFFFEDTVAADGQLISNILIDDIRVMYPASGGCSATDGRGCRPNLVYGYGPSTLDHHNIQIDGLTFTNLRVQNMSGTQQAFSFNGSTDTGTLGTYSMRVANLTITDSKFLNNDVEGAGEDDAFIALPYGGSLTGITRIERNVFTTPTTDETAIYVNAAGPTPQGANSTAASGIYIQDNYFDGYQAAASAVRFSRTGTATFTRNTFGSNTRSSSTADEETTDSGMFNNVDTTANQEIRTWYPTAAAVLTGPLPQDAAVAHNASLDPSTPTCLASVSVVRPTTTPIPENPVTLDVYWTSGNDAEVYLGSASGISGQEAQLIVPLPIGTVQFPSNVDADATIPVTVVNPSSGAVGGNLRVQTQVQAYAQLQSSQYSRVVALTGNTCQPVLTINQADGQNDPAMSRHLHFTLTTSMLLEPASLTTGDITPLAIAVPGVTIDPDRIFARVVSVTQVDGSEGFAYDVVVRVDDSATVSVTVPVGAVVSASGIANSATAGSTDPSVIFTNPLVATPAQLVIITGATTSVDYVIGLRTGAPIPSADLFFTSTLDQASIDHQVEVSTLAPTIPQGAQNSAPIAVRAADDDTVIPGTTTAILHTVSSADPNYNGLLVPPMQLGLFAVDPRISISKQAYVDVADTSSTERIVETGTLAASDAKLIDRQLVCWVYTVRNESTETWATRLTGITVTDTDTRLGNGGVIGVVPSLAIGESAQLSACGSLVAVDTTQGGPVEPTPEPE